MTNKKKAAPKAAAKKTLTEPTATIARVSMKEAKTAPAPKAETPAAQPDAPAVAQPTGKPAIEVAVSSGKSVLTVGQFQQRLHERGYYHGWWDGQYGPHTRHAVACFQAANGLTVDGEPSQATLAALGF